MPRWRWTLTRLTRRLWVRASLIGLLGIFAAMLATTAEHLIPMTLPALIGSESVSGILNILASSMLAVTTFSLSVMTAAYGSATSNVTPRAVRLLVEDRTSQNVLSTFVGSFLFAMVGIIALETQSYGERGRLVLFIITLGVLALVVVSLLRWIDHLTLLGRVSNTTLKVEQATARTLQQRLQNPWLGGKPRGDAAPPANARPLLASRIGYVQHLDTNALQQCAETHGLEIFIDALPGTFVYPDTPLAWLPLPDELNDSEALMQKLCAAFTIDHERSYDQDPRFGLVVLSEIASRALSPAVNDAGTAIDVIGRATRLLSQWADGSLQPAPAVICPRLWVPGLKDADLFEDAFWLLARDGAEKIEVQLRLRKALQALARQGGDTFADAARQQAQIALARAEEVLTQEHERVRLRAIELA